MRELPSGTGASGGRRPRRQNDWRSFEVRRNGPKVEGLTPSRSSGSRISWRSSPRCPIVWRSSSGSRPCNPNQTRRLNAIDGEQSGIGVLSPFGLQTIRLGGLPWPRHSVAIAHRPSRVARTTCSSGSRSDKRLAFHRRVPSGGGPRSRSAGGSRTGTRTRWVVRTPATSPVGGSGLRADGGTDAACRCATRTSKSSGRPGPTKTALCRGPGAAGARCDRTTAHEEGQGQGGSDESGTRAAYERSARKPLAFIRATMRSTLASTLIWSVWRTRSGVCGSSKVAVTPGIWAIWPASAMR